MNNQNNNQNNQKEKEEEEENEDEDNDQDNNFFILNYLKFINSHQTGEIDLNCLHLLEKCDVFPYACLSAVCDLCHAETGDVTNLYHCNKCKNYDLCLECYNHDIKKCGKDCKICEKDKCAHDYANFNNISDTEIHDRINNFLNLATHSCAKCKKMDKNVFKYDNKNKFYLCNKCNVIICDMCYDEEITNRAISNKIKINDNDFLDL
jgi:hypothetical protein